MTYDEFLNYIRESVEKIVIGEEGNKKVTIHKVLKNNDIVLDALIVTDKITNISPTIYLNSYFDEYVEGRYLGDIVNEIYGLYEDHKDKIVFDIDLFSDFTNIKGRIAFKLINSKTNEKLLCEVPFIPFLDLAIVFYCIIDSDLIGSAITLVHNEHLEMWAISLNELYEVAKINTPRILPGEIKSMDSIIKNMLIHELEKDETISNHVKETGDESYYETIATEKFDEMNGLKKDIKMYVLSNKARINGAACILYENILDKFARKMKRDIYILPSSIHEVILVPANKGVIKSELSCMVREVNIEAVDEGEVLSDHVYLYRRDIKQICM